MFDEEAEFLCRTLEHNKQVPGLAKSNRIYHTNLFGGDFRTQEQKRQGRANRNYRPPMNPAGRLPFHESRRTGHQAFVLKKVSGTFFGPTLLNNCHTLPKKGS
jgi:hypothetical protein